METRLVPPLPFDEQLPPPPDYLLLPLLAEQLVTSQATEDAILAQRLESLARQGEFYADLGRVALATVPTLGVKPTPSEQAPMLAQQPETFAQKLAVKRVSDALDERKKLIEEEGVSNWVYARGRDRPVHGTGRKLEFATLKARHEAKTKLRNQHKAGEIDALQLAQQLKQVKYLTKFKEPKELKRLKKAMAKNTTRIESRAAGGKIASTLRERKVADTQAHLEAIHQQSLAHSQEDDEQV